MILCKHKEGMVINPLIGNHIPILKPIYDSHSGMDDCTTYHLLTVKQIMVYWMNKMKPDTKVIELSTRNRFHRVTNGTLSQ